MSARLASSGPPLSGGITLRPTIQQFVEWTTEQVCEWMAEVGFNHYVPHVERYVRSGRHLLNMQVHELEKVVTVVGASTTVCALGIVHEEPDAQEAAAMFAESHSTQHGQHYRARRRYGCSSGTLVRVAPLDARKFR